VARQTARAGAAASPALLSIGQVLARLTPEFPDLSSSKLRFLEERGLITPARTASGYRKFSPSDLERLRIILAMQRDHYLPLKVIKAYLTDLDAGSTR
jgi:DNA-binding transcriptional MerR regulator